MAGQQQRGHDCRAVAPANDCQISDQMSPWLRSCSRSEHMKISYARGLSLLLLGFATAGQARVVAKVTQPSSQPFTALATNDATKMPLLTSASKPGASILRAQILLDRAHCSPGEI